LEWLAVKLCKVSRRIEKKVHEVFLEIQQSDPTFIVKETQRKHGGQLGSGLLKKCHRFLLHKIFH
jgi:hypothetical protein